jgi:hypothetical protein
MKISRVPIAIALTLVYLLLFLTSCTTKAPSSPTEPQIPVPANNINHNDPANGF